MLFLIRRTTVIKIFLCYPDIRMCRTMWMPKLWMGLRKHSAWCQIIDALWPTSHYFEAYRICLIKRTVPNKRTRPPPPPLFFAEIGGPASTNDRLLMLNLPPRSNQNQITYLSSCLFCKPALNSAISAVPSCSHCSYSPHDRTIDQLTIFSRAYCCGKRLSTLNSESRKVQ